MHPDPSSPRSRELAVRVVCLLIAAVSAVALILVSAPRAQASGAADSSMTVSWAGDTSSAATDQPSRDTASPHYSSLKNITVTVDQTQGVGDQAIGVTVHGFAATRGATDQSGTVYTDAMNFMQAMQCWGNPNDANFAQTCEWGGRYGPNNGVGTTVYPDNLLRVPPTDIAPVHQGDPTHPTADPNDLPFVGVDDSVTTGHQIYTVDDKGVETSTPSYPLFQVYSQATTNEVMSARIAGDGSGSFDFQAQNSDDAPQMGCGSAAHLRCWLVLVPRDTIYGGHGSDCSFIQKSVIVDGGTDVVPYAYGQANAIQAGSPVNPKCDYWQNRMVVPLNFTPTGNNCPSGAGERRMVGSELLVGAMASWQPQLCKDLKTVFSLDTDPDSLARAQLVESQVGLAFGSDPVSAGELNDADASTLTTTQISYAPIAVTSAVFGFLAEGNQGRITTLNLSPRLVAKLLTQSYVFTVPSNSGNPSADFLHLPAQNRKYATLNEDPDFQQLNPTNWAQFTSNPAIVLPGPNSADVIAQLWKWIDADSDARTWLSGVPDKWGMSINPYYLPKGDPNAQVPTFDSSGQVVQNAGVDVTAPVGLAGLDGTPTKIGEVPQNSFIKADGSLVPKDMKDSQGVRYPFGSTQFSPYADTFQLAARSAFRADPGSKTIWDPNQVDAAGDKGAWISGGAQIPGQRFTIAFTDASSAALFDLSTASLQIDNKPSKFVAPTTATLSAALTSALSVTSNPAVSEIDPTLAGDGEYPLTSVIYAAVNLSGTDAAARTDYSKFITQATTSGQVPGVGVGQLPPGYVPLTSAQAAQAAAAATAIASFVPSPAGTGDDGGTPPQPDGVGLDGGSGGDGTNSGGPTVTGHESSGQARTPRSPAGPVGQTALWGSLGAGLAGAIFAPVFLRRRRIL